MVSRERSNLPVAARAQVLTFGNSRARVRMRYWAAVFAFFLLCSFAFLRPYAPLTDDAHKAGFPFGVLTFLASCAASFLIALLAPVGRLALSFILVMAVSGTLAWAGYSIWVHSTGETPAILIGAFPEMLLSQAHVMMICLAFVAGVAANRWR